MTRPMFRTVEDLEALDPDTLLSLSNEDGSRSSVGELRMNIRFDDIYLESLPAAVIATGEQVRAARDAVQEAILND